MSKWIITLIWIFILSGCSVLKMKIDPQENGYEENYWGLEYAASKCALDRTVLSLNPILLFTLPFTVLDTAGSFAVETVIFPFELFSENPELEYKDCYKIH